MILFEICGTEDHALYRELEIANLGRQYDFLSSMVPAAMRAGRPLLSQHVIKALNFQAIMYLHAYAGNIDRAPYPSVRTCRRSTIECRRSWTIL